MDQKTYVAQFEEFEKMDLSAVERDEAIAALMTEIECDYYGVNNISRLHNDVTDFYIFLCNQRLVMDVNY